MFDLITRAQAVILKSIGETLEVINQQTGINIRQVRNIYNKATERGWSPGTPLLTIHLQDAPRSGRPRKITPLLEAEIIEAIQQDRYGREQTVRQLSDRYGISHNSIWKILRKKKFRKTKPTRKPGLTKAMKEARYQFAKRYEHFTLEDWKRIIWTDETSIMLGHRRGGYRVWRQAHERCVKSCIRERWSGYSEFMFWGSFTYDFKGPCHIWRPETKKEKSLAIKDLEIINSAIELEAKSDWELDMQMRRMGLRNKGIIILTINSLLL